MLQKQLTSSQVADIIGIKPQTLRVWRCTGRGPKYHRYGERYSRAYYNPDEVQKWLEARKFKHTSEETVQNIEQTKSKTKVGDSNYEK